MKQRERGSTMVETMLVMLLSLTVIIGIVEFGRALFTYHAVANAARLATRYAIVHGANCIPSGCTANESSIQTYVRDSTPGVVRNKLSVLQPSWTGTALDPNKSCGAGANENRGCTVIITVQYPFTFMLPYIGPNFTMSSTSQMVIAN
jgi:Flp pilus assembly protein TadG